MNHMQTAVITLLKSAVTGEAYPLPREFSLEEALPFIKRQHILCPVYAGAVRCGIPESDPLMQQIFHLYCRIMMISEHQMQAVGAIFSAFDAAGIDYLPLKGCRMKSLYPAPELRWMSDADILIRAEAHDRIRTIMPKLGFAEQAESDHELIWHSDALHVELHKRLIPSTYADLHAYFGDGWQRAKPACGARHEMRPEDDFIFLFGHFVKHYRNGGIGCRYVLDLWVYRRAYPEMDEAYITAELDKIGIAEFYRNMLHLMDVWFEGADGDEKTDFITDVIFRGGSWGTNQDRAMALGALMLRPNDHVRAGKLRLIWDSIFPTLKAMQYRHPVLKRHPRLLPLFWPVRWVDVLLFRHRSLRRRGQILKTVTAEGIEAHRQALEYVGLPAEHRQHGN